MIFHVPFSAILQRAATILIIAAVASARPSDEWEPEGHSHTEHTKPYHVTVVKKIGVPIPHPVAVSVPQYVKIPIPQPYPVHVTVEQPIHVPVYKVCYITNIMVSWYQNKKKWIRIINKILKQKIYIKYCLTNIKKKVFKLQTLQKIMNMIEATFTQKTTNFSFTPRHPL